MIIHYDDGVTRRVEDPPTLLVKADGMPITTIFPKVWLGWESSLGTVRIGDSFVDVLDQEAVYKPGRWHVTEIGQKWVKAALTDVGVASLR